jgi:hypothetical protein
MKKTIFYTGPYDNGFRPHKFMRLLSEYYYKRKMCSGCGKAYNSAFGNKS